MQKTDIFVKELVQKVKRGELILPEMQRRYVWPAKSVRDLLDSLYRGYPSGTILVWETDEDVETRELAVSPTQSPTTSGRLLLLDGQQRITSLSAILSGEPVHVRSKNRQKTIEIMFNLEHPDSFMEESVEIDESAFTAHVEDVEDEDDAERDIIEELNKRTFVVASSSLQNNPLWISVTDIFNKTDSQILRNIGINSDDEKWDKYSERLKKVRNIENYQYVMQVLQKDMSYEEVTQIFVRVNSLGIKLRGSDLAMAQISSRWRGFVDQMENFAKEFGEDEGYIIDSGILVRSLIVCATKQCKFKTVAKINKEKLESSWDMAKEGMRFAINFMRSNAGIDNLKYLSSPFLLIPIAVYAMLKNGDISNEDEKKMLKWLYNAHMRGHYSMGSSESILDADLAILFRKTDLDALIGQLFNQVKRFEVDSVDLAHKGIRSPFFSMLYFVFKKKGAKDWLSNLALSDGHIGKAHTIQYHHIFPKSLLRDAKYDTKEINELSNMAFIGGKTNRHILNKEPIKYLENEVLAKRGEEALTSQLIPLDRSLWEMNNYMAFLEYRRNAVAKELNDFMKNLD